MAKIQKHNLNFSDDEKGIKKEKLSDDTPKKKHTEKVKKEMKQKDNLKFEENKVKPSAKLKEKIGDNVKHTPVKATQNTVHQKIENDADNNSSVDAANKGTEIAEDTVHKVRTYQRRQNRNVSDESQSAIRKEEKAERLEEKKSLREEKRQDRENINRIAEKREELKKNNPEYKSNPYSRWKQKQDIKKEYYAAKSGVSAESKISVDSVKKSAKKVADEAKEKAIKVISENKGAVIIVLGGLMALLIGVSLISGGSVLIQGATGGVSASTYPSEDEEMLKSEEYYSALEEGIQVKIDDIKSEASDDYTYHTSSSRNTSYFGENTYINVYKDVYHSVTVSEDFDEIQHDPYELISYLTAKNDYEAFTCNEMKTEMANLFAKQYKLTSKITESTSTSYSTSSRTVYEYDEEGNVSGYYFVITETETTHHYYTLKISLTSSNIDSIVPSLLTADQYDMYTIYKETKGNRDDLF